MIKILFAVLVLSIFGCSSSETIEVQLPNPDAAALDEVFGTDDSESNNNSDELPLELFGSIELPTGGFDSIPGRELVGDLSFDPFVEEDGVFISVTSFGFVSVADTLGSSNLGDPRVTLRMDNRGSSAVESAICDVEALQNGDLVSDGFLAFASLGYMDPGESGIGVISFFDDLPDGFNSFNEMRFDCRWNTEDTRIDLQSSMQQIEFLGYSISDRGYASVNLRRTNNSDSSEPILICSVEASVGNVIVDVANVGFPPLDAGGVFEQSGLFIGFTSLQGFSDDSFNSSLFYCEYLI